MINKLFLIIACLGYSANALATTFIEMDFEDGKVPYVGSTNAHPGGGYITYLGGEITNGVNPGDGTQDIQKYNNVILDASTDAGNATNGSNNSLKTQYKAGYERSFSKNTTIIKFPNTRNVYVRWYQKWSKSWEWPTDQQKLLKFKGNGQGGVFKPSGSNYISLVKKSPPPNGSISQTYVYSDYSKEPTDWKHGDSISGNTNFRLENNRWYCIETMIKSSTFKDSEGEYAYWINDDLKFHLKNSFSFVEGANSEYPNYDTTGGYYNGVELQHVLQQVDGSNITVDMPTWMDNIVISDQRIGCSGTPVAPPNPPSIFALN